MNTRSSRRCVLLSLSLVLAGLLAMPAPLPAQGLETGDLTGTVWDPDGNRLAGVAVTVKAPAPAGERTAVTDADGEFTLGGLPSGAYRVTFELPGYLDAGRTVTVVPGRTERTAAILLAGYGGGEAPPGPELIGHGTRYGAEQVDALPIGRTPFDVANLAPGVSDRTPGVGQLTLSGGFAHDSLYLVDGVDVGDHLYFQVDRHVPAQGLYLEEAIAEARVLTAVISAEHGRFTGGVVDVVTRNGGNRFAGSVRLDVNENDWAEPVYSATLGGPVLRDRAGFFLAGRDTEASQPSVFPFTGEPRPYDAGDRRLLGKLTTQLGGRHTLQASRGDFETDLTRPEVGSGDVGDAIDPRTVASSDTSAGLTAARYAGVLTPRLFAGVKVTRKDQRFTGGGGTSRDLRDSPFRDTLDNRPGSGYYNAPFFDATDPAEWNNDELAASLACALDAGAAGDHDLELGLARFTSMRIGGSSASSTGYLWLADYLKDSRGGPILDPAGRLQPLFVPDATAVVELLAPRGAWLEIETDSLWVNDRFRLGERWSFNLGFRYERVKGSASDGSEPVDTDTLVPRLAAWYDLRGDGRVRLGASWAEYAGNYHDAEFGRALGLGRSDWIASLYQGPDGVGLGFDPGFELGNYVPVSSSFPQLANVFFSDDLSSPVDEELTLSAAMQLGGRGALETIYVDRSLTRFVEDFITIDNPQTLIGLLPNDGILLRNSDLPRRDYRALQVQGRYRPGDGWRLEGHWTYQLENDGNFEDWGPAVSSPLGDYPEILAAERSFPTGRLAGFQRHKIRLWTLYDLELGRAGDLGLGLLYRYDSPRVFSLATAGVPLSDVQLARDPGYARPPETQTVFFGPRGSGELGDSHYFDLAIHYAIPFWKVEPRLRVVVTNVFDSKPELIWNTLVSPDLGGPVDEHGIWTSYIEDPDFGEVFDTGPKREVTASVGIRF